MCKIIWSKRWKDTIHYKQFCDYKPPPLKYEKCDLCNTTFAFYPNGKICFFSTKE